MGIGRHRQADLTMCGVEVRTPDRHFLAQESTVFVRGMAHVPFIYSFRVDKEGGCNSPES